MTYDQLTAALGIYAQEVAPNQAADYLAAIPVFISNAELRVSRDMEDLLASHGQNTTLLATPGSPVLSLVGIPAQVAAPIVYQGATLAYTNPVTVERLSLLVPGVPPALDGWVEYLRVSLPMVQLMWPQPAAVQVPVIGSAYFALVDDLSIYMAPTPPQPYQARVTGTWRPATLSATNQSSYIASAYPDLLFYAAMIEVAGYQQNYSASSDNPQQALSWTGRYSPALSAARAEERRRKGLAPEPPPPPVAGGGP